MTGRDTGRAASVSGEPSFLGIQRIPFRFQIGELRLFSPSAPLAVLECEPGGTLEPGWQMRLPPLGGSQGYLIRGATLPLDAEFERAPPGWRHSVLRSYPRHLVDMSTGFDAYMAKFSAKTRSTLRRKLRKFEELSGGKIQWSEYRTREEIAQFLPLARELSAKTYQERLLDAGLPDDPSFTDEALARADRGTLRAYLLFLNARAVSYLYLPVEGGRVVYAYLGYDPNCAEHSPGTVLQLLAMERLFAEAIFSVFDFTEGAGRHKELFSTHALSCADLLILKRWSRASAIARVHRAFSRAEAWISSSLDRLGVKSFAKKLVRNFLSRG